jgi:AcrR family transcriptional regulator
VANPKSPTAAAPAYRIATDRILDAATGVFAREGFDRANMDAIAAEAEATKPTLYARFGSKEGLFRAAVEREYELRKARLFQAYAGGDDAPFRARLHSWSTAYFDLVRERPDAFVLITEGERHPGAAAVIRRANEEIVDRIAGLVAEVSGRRAGNGPRLVATMISGIFTSCARAAVSIQEIDIDDAAALCESFLYGALRSLDPELIDVLDVTRPGAPVTSRK